MNRHFASPEDPWFRLGKLEVSTSVLVGLIGVVSGVASVIVPGLRSLTYYEPSLVGAGEVWRIFTWPLANSIWVVLTALILWYFGSDLERITGRVRMLWIFLGIWAGLTAAFALVAILPAVNGSYLAGLDLIQFAILLLWIAEYPTRPFFFGIPAWIFGAVIVGLQVLSLVADRNLGGLLSLVAALAIVAVLARRFGLLGAYDWVPGKAMARRPAPARTRHVPRTEVRRQQRDLSDREQLDALLDQINEKGIQSLTGAQRRELMRLRDRLRKA